MSEDKMNTAYRVASELLKDRLRMEAPEVLSEIESLTAADVIVTRGQYDHIESVLRLAGTPFTLIDPQEIDGARLRADQIIFVNCPGNFTRAGLKKLATFVTEGGYLFTTDWALKHVIEPAFPGYVAYNQRATADEVVRVEVIDRDDPFLSTLLGPHDDPQWWLEGSSYPIQLLAPEKVRVLVASKEIADRYGEAPVFITFDHGAGRVYHMISHFYLQRTETRTARHAASSVSYLDEKGISPAMRAKYRQMGVDDLQVSEVESAYTSQGIMSSILADKARQRKRRRAEEEGTNG